MSKIVILTACTIAPTTNGTGSHMQIHAKDWSSHRKILLTNKIQR